MNLAVVLYNGLDCNSALHVRALLESMHRDGDAFVIAVPNGSKEATEPPDSRWTCLSHVELLRQVSDHERSLDAIIAWTPRENVRLTVKRLAEAGGCPYLVHLEDNEDAITARHMGIRYRHLLLTPPWKFRHLNGLPIACPWRSRFFMRRAAAMTLLAPKLDRFVSRQTPSLLFQPGYDEALFGENAPDPADQRKGYDIPPSTTVITYTGTIHRGNADDMRDLYHTIALLNREGDPTRLLRTGETHINGFAASVAEAAPYVHELGFVPRAKLPGLLAMADLLIQPGRPGVFNDFRFPSKLPEFLASGRPLIMAATNLGTMLKNEQEALIVPKGTPRAFANAARRMINDKKLAQRIGTNGRAYARKHLRWKNAAGKLRAFIETTIRD